jgi:hypothetical protein
MSVCCSICFNLQFILIDENKSFTKIHKELKNILKEDIDLILNMSILNLNKYKYVIIDNKSVISTLDDKKSLTLDFDSHNHSIYLCQNRINNNYISFN